MRRRVPRRFAQAGIQPRDVVGEHVHLAVETRDIDAARHQFGFLDQVFAGVVAERGEGVGDAGQGVATERVQAMRGDVADPGREVGFDVPVQLLEHAVERGEQCRVAAVVGVAQRIAAEEWQAGDAAPGWGG